MTELLSDHTTFRVGGPVGAGWSNSAAEIAEAVKQVDAAGDDLLVLRRFEHPDSDEGFAGTVVHVASKGIEISESAFADIDLTACGGVLVTVEAGSGGTVDRR